MEARKCEPIVVASIDDKKLKPQTIQYSTVRIWVGFLKKLIVKLYVARIQVAPQHQKYIYHQGNGNNIKLHNFQSLEVNLFNR